MWKLLPHIVQWDITKKCNLKCRHCRAENLSKIAKEDLCFIQISLILQKIYSLAPDTTLVLAGGEPLMRDDLQDILFFTRDVFNPKVEILTNATLINKENVIWLTKLADGFNVSLDGASAKVHDSIRGDGAFRKTIKGIFLLLEKNTRVAVRMTYFHQGEDEREPEKLLCLLKDINIKHFNFRYLVPVGRASNQKIDALQYKRLCEKILELGEKLAIQISFSDPFPAFLLNNALREKINSDTQLLCGEAVTGCSAGFDLLYLNPQGIVQLCPYFPISIADAKTENLRQVWFNEEFLSKFRAHRSILKGKCGKCKYKFACGGCRGAAQANGNFLGEDPRCWQDSGLKEKTDGTASSYVEIL